MPAWPPERLIASTPIACSAITISALDCVSPVESSTSISRGSGCSVIWCARSISSSVVSPIAETTATTRSPASARRLMRAATFLMRSAVATDEPPYFWHDAASWCTFDAQVRRRRPCLPAGSSAADVETCTARRIRSGLRAAALPMVCGYGPLGSAWHFERYHEAVDYLQRRLWHELPIVPVERALQTRIRHAAGAPRRPAPARFRSSTSAAAPARARRRR